MMSMKAKKNKADVDRNKRYFDWVDAFPKIELDPTKLKFWRDSFLVFIIFGALGHVMDLLWRIVTNDPIESWIWQLTPIVAEPYGFGAVALMWFVYPLVKHHKIKSLAAFVVGAIVTTMVELVCGLVLTVAYGHNPYWDYSHLPFNIFGQVCLYNTVMFGFASVAFIFFAFPWFYSRLQRINKYVVYSITGLILAWYVVSVVFQFVFGFRLII